MTELINSPWWNDESTKIVPKSTVTKISGETVDLTKQIVFTDKYKIKYGYSLVGGRGVFATEDIKSEELIERCPIVPLSLRSKQQSDPVLWSYCYTKPLCDCNECKTNGFVFYMVLGHGMIYNHQDDNIADMRFNHKDLYVDIIANRDIGAGKEIFVSYGSSYFNERSKVIVE
jgi:hypothetical protein